MTVQTPDLPQTVRKPQHAVFFRQSGWLMIANIVGGAMTFGVHFLNKRIPDAEYSIFGMLLMVTAVLPTMPLQMVFAQQTASALATGRERQVAGMIRLAWLWLLALWLAGAAGIWMCQGWIVNHWELGSPVALWITMFTVLFSLLTPMLAGVLQGCQDFFWLGWSNILGGACRLGGAGVWHGRRRNDDGRPGRHADRRHHWRIADAGVVVAETRVVRWEKSAEADRAAVPWFRRVPVYVHLGHDLRQGAFYGRRDGALRGRWNIVTSLS